MQFRAGKKSQNDVSIQEPIDSDKDGNSLTLNDVVADTFDVHEDYERKEETEALYRVVNRLSGRERQIVIMRYGLSGTQPLTQQQVADILHISRSYVSRRAYCKRPERLGLMLKIVSAAKNDRPIINSTCPYFGYKKFRYLTIIYKNIAPFCCKRKFFQIFIQNFVFSYCILMCIVLYFVFTSNCALGLSHRR